MSAVERRDRQNVHEGEDDAEEGGHKPERVPVPLRREQTADGSEAAERLGAFRREEILHVAYVTREHLAAVLDASGERLEEAVVDVCHLILGLLRHIAEHKAHRLALGERRETACRHGIELAFERECVELAVHLTLYVDNSGERLHGVGVSLCAGEHIGAATHLVCELRERADGLAVEREDAVGFLQPHALGSRVGRYAVNYSRHITYDERRHILQHAEQVEVARRVDDHLLAVAQHVNLRSVSQTAIHVSLGVLELAEVGAEQDVVIMESERLSLLVELHSERHILRADVVLAPCEEAHGVDEKRQKEVDKHAAYHDKQSLPCRFRAELVCLGRLFHLLGVHRFVNHTRYLAVAAERKPTDAVRSVAVLRLELEQTEPRVEEEVELLDAHSEELREEEVSALVQEHEKRDSQHELECLYKKYFHLRVLSFEF